MSFAVAGPTKNADATRLLLGVDGGGTKTVAWLAELRESGAVILGRGSGGPSNPRDVGIERAQLAIQSAVSAAYADAGRQPSAAAIAVLAVAGAAHGEPRDELGSWCTRSGLAAVCHVVPDTAPLLAAGTPAGWGIALIAGTGSSAFARDSAGEIATAGGFGYLVGDEGSGFWLGKQALGALIAQLQQQGPATALADAIAGGTGDEALRQAVYQHAANRQTIASLAPVVSSLAESGDAIAAEIVAQGARELAQLVAVVARRLHLEAAPFPLALAGGVLVGSPMLRDLVAAHLAEWSLRPQPLTVVSEPVAGCIRLAETFARNTR